ncbi:MAG TPA: cold shock domain-containing protein [Hyphomicrobiaceae bacterium]|nr:cold shock domain-containing protein [Hyphomicrobiaceae bacterium]
MSEAMTRRTLIAGSTAIGAALTCGIEPTNEVARVLAALPVVTGRIKWFDASKGYGFIVPDKAGADILLHVVCVRASGFENVREGSRVRVKVIERPKGRQAAQILAMDTSTAVANPEIRTHRIISA